MLRLGDTFHDEQGQKNNAGSPFNLKAASGLVIKKSLSPELNLRGDTQLLTSPPGWLMVPSGALGDVTIQPK